MYRLKSKEIKINNCVITFAIELCVICTKDGCIGHASKVHYFVTIFEHKVNTHILILFIHDMNNLFFFTVSNEPFY